MAAFSPERWQTVGPHLDRALELDEPARVTWLAALRARDPALAADLQVLLAQHSELAAQGFLEQGPRAVVAELERPGSQGTELPAGAILSGRYRIVRFIARGGMGEVYEAEDLHLAGRVALKTIRADRGAEGEARERFRREIQLARRITHPNVCRIFDLGVHAGGQQGLLFLTMELLSGETLAERLARTGPLPVAEACALAAQLLEALAAAHAAGVVHRDFKSANVMLVPTSQGERAVVMDFGLARPFAGDGEGRGSSIGGIAGTPGYMAPEQLEGGPITPAVDVYAFGVVMLELSTGARPGATPRTDRGLPRRWAAIVGRCLQPAPGDRYPSAAAIARAVREGPRRRRVLALGGLALAGAAAAVLQPWLGGPAARPGVAVLGIANLSGRADGAWLGTALAELLTAELSRGRALRTVADEHVARVRRDLALPPAQSLAGDTLSRLRRHLGTDYLVLGSYLLADRADGRQVLLTVRLQNVVTGEVVQVAREQGSETDLVALVSRAGGALRRELGVSGEPAGGAGAVAEALPWDPRAARLYIEGLQRSYALDFVGATTRLEGSLRIEPDFPLAHAALASIWMERGHQRRAREHARLAFERSAGHDPDARLMIEARLRETNNEWARAAEIYRGLWQRYPDEFEYGLALASAQGRGEQARSALLTTADLRRLPAPHGDDPRIDLVEAVAFSTLSDYPAKEAAAASAIRKGQARGARELVAAAAIHRGWALERLGRFDEGLAEFAVVQRLSESVGNRTGVGQALHGSANIQAKKGDSARAVVLEEQAIEILRAVGDDLTLSRAINVRAIALGDQGRLAASVEGYREAALLQVELGAREDAGYALSNEALTSEQIGDLTRAEAAVSRAREHFQAVGSRFGLVLVDLTVGRIARRRGELALAASQAAAAKTASQELRYVAGVAFADEELGEIWLSQGRRSEARAAHEAALAARRTMKASSEAAASELALARIELDDGRPGQAEILSRSALAGFEAAGQRDSAASAELVLAATLARLGRSRESRAALGRATSHAQRSEDFVLRVRALAASTLDPVRLDAVARGAARAGFVELALEVKLAGAGSARARRDLARTARAKGLHRLAALATSRPR